MYRIAVIPGDGIGPEVIAQALRVLEQVAAQHGFRYHLENYPFGADHYLETGQLLPESALEEIRNMDAVLLGAIGDPRVGRGVLERGIVATLRFELDLFVNLRPIKLYNADLCPLKGKTPADLDMVVVRENTEDVYTGLGGFMRRNTPHEIALTEAIYTRRGVERVVRYAFDLARLRPRKHLTLVDKANAVPAHDLWRRTFAEVARDYPDVTTATAYVDAAAMWMVKNPEWFDVVVTTNMFGDILTDLGAVLVGGMGLAASANLHPGQVSLFEPIHGSAPKYAGMGTANPLGAVLAVAMMLDFLGQKGASAAIEEAVAALLNSGQLPDLSAHSGRSTREVGDLLLAELERTRKPLRT
ncbi:MAG TPA: 3-isopropylmalate dehydrogenase [Candidatus Nitrosotenuis sp.]|nr:3-isopropylmalate dehydrogenase [Candidatus Nitrosotenuis sp.]